VLVVPVAEQLGQHVGSSRQASSTNAGSVVLVEPRGVEGFVSRLTAGTAEPAVPGHVALAQLAVLRRGRRSVALGRRIGNPEGARDLAIVVPTTRRTTVLAARSWRSSRAATRRGDGIVGVPEIGEAGAEGATAAVALEAAADAGGRQRVPDRERRRRRSVAAAPANAGVWREPEKAP
jgi:hypothetical protein